MTLYSHSMVFGLQIIVNKGFIFCAKYIRNSILQLTEEMYINFLFSTTTEYAEDNPVLLGKISEGLSI